MNILHSIPIPVLDGYTGKALVWLIEFKYMAVADEGEELAFIEEEHANTQLYDDDEVLALQRCQLDVELPLTDKARYLGFGRLLITSYKHYYILIESAGNDSNSTFHGKCLFSDCHSS